DDAVLIFGNAAFYYWAERPPASRFFHFPAYLLDSPLLPQVGANLQQALAPGNAGAVLASRMHLEERLTEPITAVLWQHWVPVQLFSYPYQRDMFLFLPKTAVSDREPAALFAGEIRLTAVTGQVVDEQHVLVRLDWKAETAVSADYVAFVHLLRPDGSLLSQHDGVPVVGYRPTTSWQPNEPIIDWHWVEIPVGTSLDEITVSIGLYDPAAGDRLPLQSPTTEVDSFTISWNDLTITQTKPTD
ncbi:MAG: hypothetical protein KC421_27755, partial [Anaerolineales bacterium]|nr:hypothetical protein [Anaerolineales bacterium]